jgi:CPA1 family monovalent cation:H+ antiporter
MGLRYIAHWEWSSAILFSILIAATDPVSVIAAFKDAGAGGRLRLLIEAESLCNDGTAAALFAIAAIFVSGASLSTVSVGQTVLLQFGGGIVAGAVAGGIILLLAGRTTDHLVEITLTTVAAYGSFLLAEHFHSSGVLATLVAGLMLGNLGPLGAISQKGKEAVESFWEYAAFVANSFVFLLIGMNESREHFAQIWAVAVLAIVLVLAGRAAAVYLTLLPFRRSSAKVSMRQQHVLFWGGLRGALALALALGLPDTLPRRDEIIAISFAVVVFSVFVQGVTLPPLLRRMGELPAASQGN